MEAIAIVFISNSQQSQRIIPFLILWKGFPINVVLRILYIPQLIYFSEHSI